MGYSCVSKKICL